MASNSRTMVIEIKYIKTNNAVIHTENCKLLLKVQAERTTKDDYKKLWSGTFCCWPVGPS